MKIEAPTDLEWRKAARLVGLVQMYDKALPNIRDAGVCVELVKAHLMAEQNDLLCDIKEALETIALKL